MNLILFEPGEWESPLSPEDPRMIHLKTVLKRGPGEEFDAGVIDGPRGKSWIREENPRGILLGFRPGEDPPPLSPLILAVGASRPQTARKVLLQATAMGVSRIHFFASAKGERGYFKSKIYRPESIRPYLLEGAQQAFCTRLPIVEVHDDFYECLEVLCGGSGVCLDNYEAVGPLHRHDFPIAGDAERLPLTLWIGSERGWSARERDAFRANSIPLRGLGSRVLRTETAVVAGLALCLAGLGEMG